MHYFMAGINLLHLKQKCFSVLSFHNVYCSIYFEFWGKQNFP